MSRADYLQAKYTWRRSSPHYKIAAELSPSDYGIGFIVEYGIGEPLVSQLAVIDTSSALSWVQCIPCRTCFHQSLPMFNPFNSSTYTPYSCSSYWCDMLKDEGKCDFPTNQCLYNVSYMDGTRTQGELAKEQFTFPTALGGELVLQNLTFGCGNQNSAPENSLNCAVFGLNGNPLSLASQVGNMFSYCIGSVTDPTYSYNTLILGYGFDVQGYSTPLDLSNELYRLTLQSISIGEKSLNINRDRYGPRFDINGTVLDSGTTFTYLVKEAYNPLLREVEDLTEGVLTRVGSSRSPCYRGVLREEVEGFPAVTFRFAGGAELALDPMSLFMQTAPDRFCMAVESENVNIIGLLAQQNYNVVYDLMGKRVYFQRIDCEVLIST